MVYAAAARAIYQDLPTSESSLTRGRLPSYSVLTYTYIHTYIRMAFAIDMSESDDDAASTHNTERTLADERDYHPLVQGQRVRRGDTVRYRTSILNFISE